MQTFKLWVATHTPFYGITSRSIEYVLTRNRKPIVLKLAGAEHNPPLLIHLPVRGLVSLVVMRVEGLRHTMALIPIVSKHFHPQSQTLRKVER